MTHSLRKWVLVLIVLSLAATSIVQACGHTSDMQGNVFGGQNPFGVLPQKDTCTREAMDQCEYSCMMPGGVLDLYCYEDCIYSIC